MITEPENPNGNDGRPYYLCVSSTCKKFVCFADMRGIHPDNPLCDCDQLSRLQFTNPRPGVYGRLVFFSCALGRCGWWMGTPDVVYVGPDYRATNMAQMGL